MVPIRSSPFAVAPLAQIARFAALQGWRMAHGVTGLRMCSTTACIAPGAVVGRSRQPLDPASRAETPPGTELTLSPPLPPRHRR